mmetsp:Transcript_12979/g.54456  ORF Transcript_12979/g.54456 Transcript_12979/m.54456 type:complete len:222 (+) Transcript_12979:1709-2374(+)
MAHAATTDRAAAASAALRRSPNFSAVSCASRSVVSSTSLVALKTSTSGIVSWSPAVDLELEPTPPRSLFLRSRSLRVRAELPFQPPLSGISPTSRPSSWSSRDSGTTSAFVLGSAKTRCFTRSASVAVTPYPFCPFCPYPPSPSSTEPPPRKVMLVVSPSPERFDLPSPRRTVCPSPSDSANDEAAAPNASSGASAPRPAVSNERVASARVASPSQRGEGG